MKRKKISRQTNRFELRIDDTSITKLDFLSKFQRTGRAEIIRNAVASLFGVVVDGILLDLRQKVIDKELSLRDVKKYLKKKNVDIDLVSEILADIIEFHNERIENPKVPDKTKEYHKTEIHFYSKIRDILKPAPC